MMQAGYFSVQRVLECVAKYPYLLPRNEMKDEMKEYRNSYGSLLKTIPEIPGWYAWINLKDIQRDSPPIYIGKSSKRKTSHLRARIKEEFDDDRVIFWGTVHEHIRGGDWSNHTYATNIKRALRKVRVTHILWFGKVGLTNDELIAVESYLINKYEPTANLQVGTYKQEYAELASEAVDTYEELIEQIR